MTRVNLTRMIGKLNRALPLNYSATAAIGTAEAVPAAGGSVAIPIFLPAPMDLEDVAARNTDTATARTWGWDLYKDTGANSLDRVAACTANDTFTPSAASTRTLAAGSAPVALSPGLYWLVVQNRHATSTFGLGHTAAGGLFGPNANQTKTTTNPNGATLDFVAATWTKNSNIYGVALRGRVFGQTTPF